MLTVLLYKAAKLKFGSAFEYLGVMIIDYGKLDFEIVNSKKNTIYYIYIYRRKWSRGKNINPEIHRSTVTSILKKRKEYR